MFVLPLNKYTINQFSTVKTSKIWLKFWRFWSASQCNIFFEMASVILWMPEFKLAFKHYFHLLSWKYLTTAVEIATWMSDVEDGSSLAVVCLYDEPLLLFLLGRRTKHGVGNILYFDPLLSLSCTFSRLSVQST